MNGRTGAIAAIVGALVGLVALTGCMGGGDASRAAAGEAPAAEAFTAEGSAAEVSDLRGDASPLEEPLDVNGTPATIQGNRVSTACFDFTTPDIGEPWILSPYARNCQTEVNWSSGDMLTHITVKVQTGGASVVEMEDAFASAGFEILDSVDKEVNGRPSHVYHVMDGYGLVSTAVVIDLPPGRFHAEGEPVTDLFIAGSTHSEGLMDIFEELVLSIEIH